MNRTFALTAALALASLGVSAYAQTTPATQPGQTQETTKTKKKHSTKKHVKKHNTSSTTTQK